MLPKYGLWSDSPRALAKPSATLAHVRRGRALDRLDDAAVGHDLDLHALRVGERVEVDGFPARRRAEGLLRDRRLGFLADCCRGPGDGAREERDEAEDEDRQDEVSPGERSAHVDHPRWS